MRRQSPRSVGARPGKTWRPWTSGRAAAPCLQSGLCVGTGGGTGAQSVPLHPGLTWAQGASLSAPPPSRAAPTSLTLLKPIHRRSRRKSSSTIS